jgi:PAS domain S-box-containing protein
MEDKPFAQSSFLFMEKIRNSNKTKKQLVAELGELRAEVDRLKNVERSLSESVLCKQTEAILRESRDRFQSAFDYAVNGMALVNLEGQWLKVNPALCKILGYSEQELLQSTSHAMTHPEDLDQHLNALHQLLTGETHSFQLEKRYIHRLGHPIWVISSTSLVRDGQGQPLYLVTQIQDITERRAIEQMKNEFISVVSHELRTPLASIRGSLGLLAAGVLDSKPKVAKEMLETAAFESERLVPLVNEILDLERLEANKVMMNRHKCDVTTLMRRSVEIMRPIADENSITLVLLPTSSPTSSQVWADADWIVQVLVNLLGNALKFSPPKSRISLSAQALANEVLFQVQDQGRGIPTAKLEAIFRRFQQVDASDARDKGGTGLGLTICRNIVQRHGGRIWVASTVGKGSTFYFTLPTPPDTNAQ